MLAKVLRASLVRKSLANNITLRYEIRFIEPLETGALSI